YQGGYEKQGYGNDGDSGYGNDGVDSGYDYDSPIPRLSIRALYPSGPSRRDEIVGFVLNYNTILT
ncbi:unnamed protein product, partial [Aphanomyces euteiches]